MNDEVLEYLDELIADMNRQLAKLNGQAWSSVMVSRRLVELKRIKRVKQLEERKASQP